MTVTNYNNLCKIQHYMYVFILDKKKIFCQCNSSFLNALLKMVYWTETC
jgi:hypothetical protein